MLRFIRSHPYCVAATATAVLAGLVWLAFGYFGVHTLFVDDVVSEAAPVFDAPAPADGPASAAPAPPSPATDDAGSDAVASTTPEVPAPPAATAPAATEIVAQFGGVFIGASRYSTDGQAVVLGNGTGQRFLRFEEFATDNGPDLNVYLVNSSTDDVSDFVDLGDLKGNIGEQNYEIPPEVDLAVYDRVVIWCVRFGAEFGSATLSMV